MILAGIDEAGFGPLLGPLCVGAVALRLDPPSGATAADLAGPPDAWQLLRAAVTPTRDRTGRRLHVADSKKVYASRGDVGLRELERTTLALAAAAGGQLAGGLDAFSSFVGVSPPGTPWYAANDREAHPAAADATALAITTNALRHAADAAGVAVLPPRVRALFEPEYNRLCAATRNKAAALQTVVAGLLYDLLEARAAEPGGLYVVLDRQGGRSHYAPFLRQMFEDWSLSVLAETDGVSDYMLRRGSAAARLTFAEKGESLCLATAAASCFAKYVRERYMGRFNAWWSRQMPGLAPTAGYWTDGLRWLEETADLRKQLGVADADLIRER